MSQIERQTSELKAHLTQVKAQHREDLERLYDYHATLMRLEQEDMYLSRNDEDQDLMPEQKVGAAISMRLLYSFRTIQKLYELSAIPHPRQAHLPSSIHTTVASCLPTPSLLSFTDDMSRMKYSFHTHTLLPLCKQLAALSKQKSLLNKREDQRHEQDEAQRQTVKDLAEYNARNARLEAEAKRRDQERKFPSTPDDFMKRPVDARMRAARILSLVYPDENAMANADPSSDIRTAQILLDEAGWKLDDASQLGSLWTSNVSFATLCAS